MKRRYLTPLYTSRIEKIKSVMPDCCIGVDVIVGFPGESDEDFLETYNYLNNLDISYLHVFTYSERANTPAVEMDDIVSFKKRSERSKMLRGLSEKKKRFFYEQNLGTGRQVIFENDVEDGMMHGFTENYVRVAAKYDPVLVNEVKDVKLTSINENGTVDLEEIDLVITHH